MLGTPDIYDPSFYADLPDTGDDQLFIANRLEEWGVLDQIDYRSVNVTLGDDIPDRDDFDAVIVGGSFHSMNENQPWQKRVVRWLADWQKNQSSSTRDLRRTSTDVQYGWSGCGSAFKRC